MTPKEIRCLSMPSGGKGDLCGSIFVPHNWSALSTRITRRPLRPTGNLLMFDTGGFLGVAIRKNLPRTAQILFWLPRPSHRIPPPLHELFLVFDLAIDGSLKCRQFSRYGLSRNVERQRNRQQRGLAKWAFRVFASLEVKRPNKRRLARLFKCGNA
jgi:hypothetical protein